MIKFAAGAWSGSGKPVKTGVLGGTFDPIHLGHLMAAEEARVSLGLSEILLVPAGQPLLKPAHPVATAEHRLQMLHLAIADRHQFRVSTLELDHPGPSYTVDTIAELKVRSGDGDEIYFILGWDSLAQLPEWREPSRLIKLCRLVAVPRPGCSHPDPDALEALIPGISPRLVWLEKPLVHISASAVREMAGRGLSLRHLVPEPVAAYISQHKLYTTR